MRPIIAFQEYIFRDVVPQFANLNDRATQAGQEYYQMMISQPVGDDCDGDVSGFAEDAQDQAIGWYEMMRSLRQTMLNLLAAGLFHLTEQQLALLCHDGGFRVSPPTDTNIDKVAKWYSIHLRLDIKSLPTWSLIDEFRLLAHTVKHGEGSSSRQLKAKRPELFCDPSFTRAFPDINFRDYFLRKPVAVPLAGNDVFVTEDLLKHYAEGVGSFFGEIADHFAAHADEDY
jgi:hypothetical protein